MEDNVARVCGAEGCDRPFYGKGYCNAHWQQVRAGKEPGKIRALVAHIEFCSIVGCGRKRETSVYCQRHYDDVAAGRSPVRKIRERRVAGAERAICPVPRCEELEWTKRLCRRHHRLRVKFNFSDDMIVSIYRNATCEICGRNEPEVGRQFHIDHDHNCCGPNAGCDNCVRGLLCPSCNQGIGMFKDDPRLLQSAIEYLNRSVR